MILTRMAPLAMVYRQTLVPSARVPNWSLLMCAFMAAGMVRAGAADAAVPAAASPAASAMANDALPAIPAKRNRTDLTRDLTDLLTDPSSMGTPFWGGVNRRARDTSCFPRDSPSRLCHSDQASPARSRPAVLVRAPL